MIPSIRRCALGLSLALAFAAAPAFSAQPPLSPADAHAAIAAENPPQVLDVRSAEEYAEGHVPGAMLIPHDELASRLSELDRDRPVLVYCRSGRRSTLAETLLETEGFDVRQIDGSWQRWQAEGLPEEKPVAATPTENER
jgi:phage shock protein E